MLSETEAALLEEIAQLKSDLEWKNYFLIFIRDKAFLKFNSNVGLCAFSDLREAAVKQFNKV